jgi:[calcium/calmodulin-dependent protein kinase] kinase
VSDTVGTYQFLAPECCTGGCYDPFCADVWAIGIIMYVFLFGKLPFVSESTSDLFEEICGVEVQLPVKVSSSCKDLLFDLLKKDPTERIKMSNVLQHRWMCEE